MSIEDLERDAQDAMRGGHSRSIPYVTSQLKQFSADAISRGLALKSVGGAEYHNSVADAARSLGLLEQLANFHEPDNGMRFPGAGGGGSPLSEHEVRVLTPAMKMAELMPGRGSGFDIGLHRYLKGIVGGDWSGVSESAIKTMSLSDSLGGYTVPDPVSSNVIDLARNAARVVQAGAVTIPMTSSTLKIPRLLSDPTSAWKAENASITASDLTFEQVELVAHTLVAMVKMSIELAEDSPVAEQTVSDALAAALALEIDRAALVGAGSGDEPQGLFGAVPSLGFVGDPADYSDFSLAVQTVQQANGEPGTVIYSPLTAGKLDRLTDGVTNNPLQPPASFAALRKLQTNQCPNDLAFIGDFKQLAIGMRTSLRIEASREAGDDSETAWSNLQIWVRAYLRADIAVLRPSAFAVLEGLDGGS